MKYYILILFTLSCVYLSSTVLDSLYQVEKTIVIGTFSGPGSSATTSGTKYHYSYENNLLSTIQRYTYEQYTPPGIKVAEKTSTWVLQDTWQSESQFWQYPEYFEIKQLFPTGTTASYRYTRYTNEGYILSDKVEGGKEYIYQYSDNMKLIQKDAKLTATSFGRWLYEYDSLSRRNVCTHLTSDDSLNWSQYRRYQYTYSNETQPDGFYPEKYENYIMLTEVVPYVSNTHKLLHINIQRFSEGEWVYHYQMNIYEDNYNYCENGPYNCNFQPNGLCYDNEETSGTYYRSFDVRWYAGSSDSEDELVPEANATLSCYPNPFTNKLTIELPKSEKELLTVQGYNLKGQLVMQRVFNPMPEVIWDGKDDSGLNTPSGIYLIRITQNGKNFTKKVIKL